MATGADGCALALGPLPAGVFQISGLHNTNRSSSMSKACLTPYQGRRMSSTADSVAFWSARLARSARTLACASFCGSERPAGQARTPEDGHSPPKGCNELTQKVEIHPFPLFSPRNLTVPTGCPILRSKVQRENKDVIFFLVGCSFLYLPSFKGACLAAARESGAP